MAIDIDAVIEEGRKIINELSAITRLAQETKGKVAGFLTSPRAKFRT